MRSQYTEGYKIEETDITLNNGGIIKSEENTRAFRRGMNPTIYYTTHRR